MNKKHFKKHETGFGKLIHKTGYTHRKKQGTNKKQTVRNFVSHEKISDLRYTVKKNQQIFVKYLSHAGKKSHIISQVITSNNTSVISRKINRLLKILERDSDKRNKIEAVYIKNI